MMPSVVVVGAGMVGTTTAHLLRSRLGPNVEVTLLADLFDSDTTSNGAAGVFRVNDTSLAAPDRLRRWCQLSYDYYFNLARSGDAANAGAFLLPNHELFADPDTPEPYYVSFCDFNRVSARELGRLGMPAECKTAFRYLAPMLESRYHLPFMREKFQAMGGVVERRRIESWADIEREFDLAVNCTGLGAAKLCNDTDLVPVRGQVLRVRAPWLRQGWYLNRPTSYVYPGRELTVLGGTRQVGNSDTTPSDEDTARILEQTRRLEPSLALATVVETWVGLRPFRKRIRVEADTNAALPIVHNYGHGGHGISLAFGTSVEAVELTERLLKHVKPKL